MKSLLIIFLILINYCTSFSQNLTGTWEGQGPGTSYWQFVIVQIGDSCFCYNYDVGMGYCKTNVLGNFNSYTKKFKATGLNFIEKTFFHALVNYNLKYSKNGDQEFLIGSITAKTLGAKLYSFGLPMPAHLHKKSDKIDTTAFMALKISQHAPFVREKDSMIGSVFIYDDSILIKKESRTSTLIKTIYTNNDSIKLALYDAGEIDGDIVTVFDNNKMVVNKLLLTSKAFEITIPLNDLDSLHKIQLVAENLGSIPPNTAYMLITAGTERYELKASSDLSTNAEIIIQYKKQ